MFCQCSALAHHRLSFWMPSLWPYTNSLRAPRLPHCLHLDVSDIRRSVDSSS